MEILKNFVGGKWEELNDRDMGDVYNPATGEVIARVPFSTAEDIDRAVEKAADAYASWRKVPVIKRTRYIFQYLEIVRREREALSRMVTTEHGKSYVDALAEVDRGIESLEHAAAAPTLMMGESLADVASGLEQTYYRYPLGVVAGITPYNFPVMIPLWVIPWAIVTGNTLLLKPSEQTPMTTVRLVELLQETDLPPGVVNIVHGAKDAVNALLAHPRIQAITFTGSQPTAAYIYETAAKYHKRVQAFSGAKNHAIVLRDAHLEPSIDGILRAAFHNGGQRCMATSVVVVEEAIADEVVARLAEGARRMKVGHGFEENVDVTPLIRDAHRARVVGYIDGGVQEAAELVVDGRAAMKQFEKGFYLGPTVFDRVTPAMRIWQEEIFGPVLSVVRVKDLGEAIEVTNRSRFANGAIIYTESGKAAHTFREEIDAGMVGVNVNIPLPVAFFPFGGHKDSFYGAIGENGKDAVQFFTRKKTVSTRWF